MTTLVVHPTSTDGAILPTGYTSTSAATITSGNGDIYQGPSGAVAIRFPSANLPANVNILSATLGLGFPAGPAKQGQSITYRTGFTLFFEQSASSASLTTAAGNVAGRTWNSITTAWDNTYSSLSSSSTVAPSPDCSKSLRELIAQSGWGTSSAVTILVQTSANTYDNDTEDNGLNRIQLFSVATEYSAIPLTISYAPNPTTTYQLTAVGSTGGASGPLGLVPPVGSLNIGFAVNTAGSNTAPSTITDSTTGASYTSLGNIGAVGRNISIWGLVITPSIVASAGGQYLNSTGSSSWNYQIMNFVGNWGSVATILDVAAASVGSGASASNSSVTAPSLTTATAHDLILTALSLGNTSGTLAPSVTTSNYTTTVNSSSNPAYGFGYNLDSGSASTVVNPYFSWTTARAWSQLTVALKPAANAPKSQTIHAAIGLPKTKSQTINATLKPAPVYTSGLLLDYFANTLSTTKTLAMTIHARISQTIPNPQTINASVSKTFTNPQAITAQVSQSITNPLTITARISQTIQNPLTITARISQNITNLQTITARISRTINSPQTITVRISKFIINPLTITARISQTITNPLTVNARVSKSIANPQTITARISKVIGNPQTVTARVSKTITNSLAITARISQAITTPQVVSARVSKAITSSQTITTRVSKAITSPQTITARVSQSIANPQSVNARVSKTIINPQTITAGIYVISTNGRNIYADIRKSRTNAQSITSRISIDSTISQNIYVSLQKTITRSQTINASILPAGTKEKVITLHADIRKGISNTLAVQARISNSPTNIQTIHSDITKQNTASQIIHVNIQNDLTSALGINARILRNGVDSQSILASISNSPISQQLIRSAVEEQRNTYQTINANLSLSTISHQIITANIKRNIVSTQNINATIFKIVSNSSIIHAEITTPARPYALLNDGVHHYRLFPQYVFASTLTINANIKNSYTGSIQIHADLGISKASSLPVRAKIYIPPHFFTDGTTHYRLL